MLHVFDTVLRSNDLSLDRVLNAGVPVVALFHEGEPAENLRHSMDQLAERYAGKALLVLLARQDAQESAHRFNIHHFPTLVIFRGGKPISQQEDITVETIKAQLAYLAGEGPDPASQAPVNQASQSRVRSTGPIEANEATFEQEVLKADRPVLVDFWAVWCGPCKMMEPALEKLAHERADAMKVVKLNVDENPGIASRYGVMGIPTMIVVQNGQEVDRLVGAIPETALRNRLARWLQTK